MNEEQRTAKRVGRPQRSADQMGQPQRAAKNEAEDAGVPMRVSRVKRVGQRWRALEGGDVRVSSTERTRITPDLGTAGGGGAAYENEYRRTGLAGGSEAGETNGRTDGQTALAVGPSGQAASVDRRYAT